MKYITTKKYYHHCTLFHYVILRNIEKEGREYYTLWQAPSRPSGIKSIPPHLTQRRVLVFSQVPRGLLLQPEEGLCNMYISH